MEKFEQGFHLRYSDRIAKPEFIRYIPSIVSMSNTMDEGLVISHQFNLKYDPKYTQACTEEYILSTFYQTEYSYVIALQDNVVIGMATILNGLYHESCNINKFIIEKEYRGMGYGSKFLKQLMLELKRDRKYKFVGLNVIINNIPAMKLYKKLGFSPIEEYRIAKL